MRPRGGRSGCCRARIEGQLVPPSGLDLAVKVEGTRLAGLSPLVGFDLPTTPNPYRLAGQVTGSLTDLRIEGVAADSTLSGALAVQRPEQQAPRMEGQLVADRLDLDRLIALVRSAAGEKKRQETTPLERAAATVKPAAEASLPLDALNAFNAERALRIHDLLVGGAEFRNASLSLVLRNGRLSIQDLTMQAAGGTVAGGAAVDASQPGAEVRVHLNADNIEVAKLLTELGAPQDITTAVDIDLNIGQHRPVARCTARPPAGQRHLVGGAVGEPVELLFFDAVLHVAPGTVDLLVQEPAGDH